jgi:predicted Zn-dependent peptidase
MWDLMSKTMCPDQPHGRPVLGTEQTLKAMTAQALTDYRDEFYVPNNVVFSASGPIKHKDFVALIDRKFGAMPSRAIAPLPTPVFNGGVAAIEMETAELCQFVLAMKSVPSTHPDIYAYHALGEILGGGASSRLHKALVNTALTSDVGVGSNDYRNFGNLVVIAGIDPSDTKKVIGIIYNELRKLLKTLDQKELDKAKAQMEMSALSGIESNRAACDTYGQQTLALGKPEKPAEISAKIQALTLNDIERVTRSILASDPVLAAVVPTGTDLALLPDYAEIQALRDPATQAA